MGKGGQTTTEESETKQRIDPMLQMAGRYLAPMAFDIAGIGGPERTPYQGPTIAAPNQGMRDAMGANTAALGAYGFGNVADPTEGLPQEYDYGGGMRGYTPYDTAASAVGSIDPNKLNAIDGFFGEMGRYAEGARMLNDEFMNQQRGGGSGGSGGEGEVDPLMTATPGSMSSNAAADLLEGYGLNDMSKWTFSGK